MINKLAGHPLLIEHVEMPEVQELTLLTAILDMIYINDEVLDQGEYLSFFEKFIFLNFIVDVLLEQLRLLGLNKGEHHPVFGDWDKMLNNWIRQG